MEVPEKNITGYTTLFTLPSPLPADTTTTTCPEEKEKLIHEPRGKMGLLQSEWVTFEHLEFR